MPWAKLLPVCESLNHSVTKQYKSAFHPDSQKSSYWSLCSKNISKFPCKSSLTEPSKESLNLLDHTPTPNTLHLSLERCKTAQFDQLLAEQSKERVHKC